MRSSATPIETGSADRRAGHEQLADVTVVLACHSDERWQSILAAIASVQAQLLKPAQLVVTVDHNPALAARLSAAGLGVTVVCNDGGVRGASANRNRGAQQAGTSMIAFLDDDETAEPEWLHQLVPALSDGTFVGAGGRYCPAWEEKTPFWFPDIFGWVVGAHHSAMPTTPTPVRNVWAGNMLVRTELFRSVGGFRTDFGKSGDSSQPEDTDLCIRMARAGNGSWLYVPAARIQHAVPASRSSFGFFLRRCYSEGHGKVLLGHNLREASEQTLADEGDYLRREVPRSLVSQLRTGPAALPRMLATVAGVLAAGAGAGAALLHLRRARPALPDGRPHILMVSARAFPDLGGIESHVDTLAPLIVRAGYRVTIAATDRGGELPCRDERNGIPILRYRSFPRNRDYYLSPGLFWQVLRGRYDLVHVQGINNLVPPTAMLAALLSGKKLVITFHSGGATTALRARLRRLQMALLSLLFRRAAKQIAVSDFEHEYFSALLPATAGSMRLIRNGGLPQPAGVQEPVQAGLILSVGRLERYKGHHLAIAALPEIVRRRPQARLRILGTGEYRDTLEELAAGLGVADRVQISSVPPQDRESMAQELARADVLVLLSDYEAHPIAVMEGLALGRPVVVRRNSGMSELADRGWVTGVPAEPSRDEIASAIVGSFGTVARVGPGELPSWDGCAAAVSRVYGEVLGRELVEHG